MASAQPKARPPVGDTDNTYSMREYVDAMLDAVRTTLASRVDRLEDGTDRRHREAKGEVRWIVGLLVLIFAPSVSYIIAQQMEIRGEYVQTQTRIEHMQEQSAQTQKNMEQMQVQMVQLQTQAAQTQEQIAQLQTQATQTQEQIKQLRTQMVQLQTQEAQTQEQIAQLRTQATQMQAQMTQLQAQAAHTREQLAQILAKVDGG